MYYITCVDCPYHYKNEDDDFACCHFDFGIAPCEQEEADYYYDEEQ